MAHAFVRLAAAVEPAVPVDVVAFDELAGFPVGVGGVLAEVDRPMRGVGDRLFGGGAPSGCAGSAAPPGWCRRIAGTRRERCSPGRRTARPPARRPCLIRADCDLGDLVLEPARAGHLEQPGDRVGIVIDYVDKPGCQSCGLAECPQRRRFRVGRGGGGGGVGHVSTSLVLGRSCGRPLFLPSGTGDRRPSRPSERLGPGARRWPPSAAKARHLVAAEGQAQRRRWPSASRTPA